MSFVHLHRHGEFSLLDGVGTAEQYATEAVRLEQPALALTDHGTLSGSLHHYKACKDAGVIPILGIEAYFKPNRHLKDDANKEYFHLVLLAKDLTGWHNLMRLSSEAYSSGFYYKPCLDFELLSKYNEGLICSTACISSYLCKSIIRGNHEEADKTLRFLKDTFKDDLFIEVMPHDFEDQRSLNVELYNIAQQHGVPLIATVDAHYPYKEWADTQDIVLMMATGQSFAKRKAKENVGEEVYKFDCDTLFLMSRDEVKSAFHKNHPQLVGMGDTVEDAMNATNEVLNRIVPFMVSKKRKMPKVEGDPVKIVRQWCIEGLERIGKTDDPVYQERFEYEFGILEKNDVLDYFVVVGDLCRWIKGQKIRQTCRGSAAGCLVSYLIGITHIDPIPHKLLFERFLNPDRKGMPDIDLDVQADRRADVKAYLSDKYGVDHVADVCAHQTYKPRAAIQHVGRVYDLHKEAFKVTNTIDPLEKMDLERLAELNETLDKFADAHPEPWKHACRIQGQVHTLSKHAAAVVITDKPISEYMPIMLGKQKETLTQWGARSDFNIIDEYGFMKIDILGLKSLAMQEYACDLIEKRTGERPDLDHLPVCSDPTAVDQNVLDAFTQGLVLGVFQFTGSPGFARMIKSFKPSWLGDLGAANAIYRPGPLGGDVDKQYAARKSGEEEVYYFDPRAESVLKETFGLICYQEQIMDLAKYMANFTGGEADALRKAISKEYRNGMAHVIKWLEDNGYTKKWREGCKENGIKDAVTNKVWKLILAFGDYGFNKSHAYVYAVQSYQDMWLKVNYPREFYAALLTFDSKLGKSVARESRSFGIQLLPPDINKSEFGFSIDGNGIRYGLQAVKYLGDVGAYEILSKQPFRTYEDFEERITKRHCNKRAKDYLLKSGAFDCWKMRKEWTQDQVNEGEDEALSGMRITETQSLAKYYDVVKKRTMTEEQFFNLREKEGVIIGGEIISKKHIVTSKQHLDMGFFELQFDTSNWSCTVFPTEWGMFSDLIYDGSPVMVRGRKEIRQDGQHTVIVDQMCSVEELAMALSQGE